MIYEQFDVVVVPFPFTDKSASKRRPALVLNNDILSKSGKYVLAMITSSKQFPWPLDIHIKDLDSTGLAHPSIVRMKIFTLDAELIFRKAGRLSEIDRASTKLAINALFQSGCPTQSTNV